MNTITFPKNEWDDIKLRLKNKKTVCTLRVDDEYGKYKTGDVLKTEWDLNVKIISVNKVSGGIDGLKKDYEFFDKLTEEMIQDLTSYEKIEIITLEAA
ncbi:MAG: hypothetical protein UR60_C0018G0002 [Candidatus Moranbacteria bacterium GW2011_GWF2_34_56]|nr:MAG: hypothetical protein UR51_C0021G0002 [Candidatus Moranbacteria bacterium GW2011_GWF1_34_10]KKP64615.1 MAG: hypothetical protein UR60_C0018G0002 [Candidatus Moranbacteria bacterium GW2011_GWF2_34_56]HBI17112.1 hypothetical protein [Candidatus Moranbacteria bacterium]